MMTEKSLEMSKTLTGKSVIKLFMKAKKVIDDRGLVDIFQTRYIRNSGYNIVHSGFSFIGFQERKLQLQYVAVFDSTKNVWQLQPTIYINGVYTLIYEVSPKKCYEVGINYPLIKLYEMGRLDAVGFDVYRCGNNSLEKLGTFDSLESFNEAEELAKKACKEDITKYRAEEHFKMFTPRRVHNNALTAHELGELRHYTSFIDDEGTEEWITILPKKGNQNRKDK